MTTDTHVNGHEQEEWLWPWDDFHFLRSSSVRMIQYLWFFFSTLAHARLSIITCAIYCEGNSSNWFYGSVKVLSCILLSLTINGMANYSPQTISYFLNPTTTNAISISLSTTRKSSVSLRQPETHFCFLQAARCLPRTLIFIVLTLSWSLLFKFCPQTQKKPKNICTISHMSEALYSCLINSFNCSFFASFSMLSQHTWNKTKSNGHWTKDHEETVSHNALSYCTQWPNVINDTK